MIRQYELVERVKSYNRNADEGLLNKAYVYAMRAHGSQIRASGDPFFSHPLQVAEILAGLKLDDTTIAAALLHDVIEDTETTHAEIEAMFGGEIARLVDGLTKIRRLDLATKEAAQAENLRKLLIAVSKDIRVLLIKMADRLHNMRTIQYMRAEKRIRIAHETMDIYAPLAGRMGMQDMREELEDLAFREINGQAHRAITLRLERLHEESGDVLSEIERVLSKKFAKNNIRARANGREKRPWSIWSKMERKHIQLSQLSDIFGFRVIVETVGDCYRALGVVHRNWRAVPGRFKDYISTPKQNDYRSLHTTIIGPYHKRVELQIRTEKMHDIAQNGIAAHAFYKDGCTHGDTRNRVALREASNAYRWLRHLMDVLSEGESPREFLEHTKLELFQDQVFCFTPKGDIIALPRGATVIDFAYAVHTDVGNSCVGCQIDGRPAPLMTRLNNGEEVTIMRSGAKTPPAAWESSVVTGKARAAIRRATRLSLRRQYTRLGSEILKRALLRAGYDYDEQKILAALPRLGLRSQKLADTLAAIGRGELADKDVLRAMNIAQARPKSASGRALRSLGRAISTLPSVLGRKEGDRTHAIPVRGVDSDLPLKIATRTGAVPGERIVGILIPDEGITVYPIFAHELKKFDHEPGRWIDLAWDVAENSEQHFPARIKVELSHEVGAIAQATATISNNAANINSLTMTKRDFHFLDLEIVIEVRDVKHLNGVIAGLKRQPLVHGVARAMD
ncbi:MAG: bifunctional (p)ppGpp synthetase/guanosine-3',5'-bis(diphosphate) 3'-pyrophosphohydrolase [Hyphomicrobiales bacterium]